MASQLVVCEGVLSVDSGTGAALCDGLWRVGDLAAIPGAFDPSQLDPAMLGGAFGAGFLLLWTPVLAAWGAGVLLRFISRRF